MSVVTTQPEILTSVPTTPKPWLLASGLNRFPRNGTCVDASRPIERRRNGSPDDSPMEILTRLPAVVVLERLPVPSLAMSRDGIILFANSAFAEMVGHQQDRLAGLTFPLVFNTLPATLFALSALDALANMIVELKHCEGWPVRARMSKSAFMRRDDPVVLVTFEDLTAQLWMDEE
jgi:PAS domain S-box-containing protein